MTVDSAYKIVQYVINKSQDGYLPEDEFNLIIQQAQNSFLDYLLGQFQQYAPGRPVPRVGLGNNRTVRQRLSPVIYGYTLNVDSQGQAPYPGDYIQTDAMWSIYGGGRTKIRYAEQNKLDSFYNSTIDPILSNPIYLIEDTGFKFYPNLNDDGVAMIPSQARLSYVRKPPVIHWGSVPNIYGVPVYNAATSTDPVWSDVDMLEVISRALKMVGVNLQAGQIEQYAQDVTRGGQ